MRSTVTRAVPIVAAVLGLFVLVGILTVRPWRMRPDAPHPPQAVGGVMDLRGWDAATGHPVDLRGEWEFESPAGSTLRSVPDQWQDEDAGAPHGMGSGTYRLKVLLDGPTRNLSIRVRTASTAMELRANGLTVARVGEPSTDPRQARPAYAPQVVRIPGTVGPELHLEVFVSNWEYRTGGMWEPLAIGESGVLQRAVQRDHDSAYLLAVFFACIAGMGLTVFLLRRTETTFLIFALFCASIALRVLCTGEYLIIARFPRIEFNTVIRLEYLSFMVGVPASLLFFMNFFPVGSRMMKVVVLTPYVAMLAALPFLSITALTRTVFFQHALLYVGVGFVSVYLLVRVVPRHQVEELVAVAGGMGLAIVAVHDTFASSFLIPTPGLMPISLAAFIGLMAVILGRRLLNSYDRAEVLGAELAETNVRLEQELTNTVAARTALEEALKDRDTLIHEIHHRVKNSLQIVSSIVSLQVRRTEDQAMRSMLNRMNTRIRAISLVHEKLHDISPGAGIEVSAYVRSLVGLLESAYAPSGTGIALTVPEGPLSVPIEFCVDLGLMLNELVSNAFKHGGSSERCRVEVLNRGDRLEVAVANPVTDATTEFDAEGNDGLGFKILRAVLRRSGGSMNAGLTDPDDGDGPRAVVSLRIPLPDQSEPPQRSPMRLLAGGVEQP